MSKFSSFIVFALGFAIIAVTLVTIIQKEFFPEPPPPPEERIVIPKTDLPPLDLGTREQFLANLDQIFAAGGLSAVHDYVEKEWVPGRLLKGSVFSTSDTAAARIIDREVRRCDRQGAALLDKAPVLSRVTPDLHVGRQGRLETWTRLESLQSFMLTVWYVGE
jgi:hypothetical protein